MRLIYSEVLCPSFIISTLNRRHFKVAARQWGFNLIVFSPNITKTFYTKNHVPALLQQNCPQNLYWSSDSTYNFFITCRKYVEENISEQLLKERLSCPCVSPAILVLLHQLARAPYSEILKNYFPHKSSIASMQ